MAALKKIFIVNNLELSHLIGIRNYFYRLIIAFHLLSLAAEYIEDITWPLGDTKFLLEC